MAGGTPVEEFNAAAYNTTKFAKQGDLGSKVLAPRPTGTVWKRGSLAKARWEITANHGGGCACYFFSRDFNFNDTFLILLCHICRSIQAVPSIISPDRRLFQKHGIAPAYQLPHPNL
jgi:hypothetical protein